MVKEESIPSAVILPKYTRQNNKIPVMWQRGKEQIADIKYPLNVAPKTLIRRDDKNNEMGNPKINPPLRPKITPMPPVKPEKTGRPIIPIRM